MTAFFCILTAVSVPAFAEEVELRWKATTGSYGYLLEIKNESGSVEQKKTENTSAELNLQPGRYEVRLAGLNRFGKPGPFSDWKAIRIETEMTGTVDFDEAKDADDVPQTTPEKTDSPFAGWRFYVPGLYQYQHGHTTKAWLYPAGFAALAGAFHTEKTRGDLIASDPLVDPILYSYTAYAISQEAGLLLWLRKTGERSKYDQAQQNQRYAGYGALALYAIHFADAYYFTENSVAFQILPVSDPVAMHTSPFYSSTHSIPGTNHINRPAIQSGLSVSWVWRLP